MLCPSVFRSQDGSEGGASSTRHVQWELRWWPWRPVCQAWEKDRIAQGLKKPGRARKELVVGRIQGKSAKDWKTDWSIWKSACCLQALDNLTGLTKGPLLLALCRLVMCAWTVCSDALSPQQPRGPSSPLRPPADWVCLGTVPARAQSGTQTKLAGWGQRQGWNQWQKPSGHWTYFWAWLLQNRPVVGDDMLLLNGPPFSRGSLVVGWPCLPPGNYSSPCQTSLKRKGTMYSESYADLE